MARRMVVLLVGAGLLVGLTAGPVMASDGGKAAVAKKKCKNKKGKKKKKCKKKKQQSSSTATPATPASLSISPAAMNYATILVGNTSNPTNFVVLNTGGTASGALTATLGGADPGQFQQNDSCTGNSLGPGATCTVGESFKPTTAGAKSASLSIVSGSGATAAATLTGIGGTPANLVISPTSHNFGSVVASNTGVPPSQSFMVTNTGGSSSGTLNTAFTGTNLTQFSRPSDGCLGASLAPSASCMTTVTFTPNAACAPCMANLEVTGTGPAAVATLTGTASGLAISPTSFDFGSHTPGTMTPQPFTVTNNTGAPSGLLSTPSITGVNAADYSITGVNTCVAFLAPAPVTCTFNVTFNPVETMPAVSRPSSASVTIQAAPSGRATATLTGTELP